MQGTALTQFFAVIVFLIAALAFVFAVFRLRKRGGDTPISPADIAWIALPLVALVLSTMTLRSVRATGTPGLEGATGGASLPPTATGDLTMTTAPPVAPETTAATGAMAGTESAGTARVSEAAPAGAPAAGAPSGKALYEAKCASCHQSNGLGVPGVFPPIAGAEVPNGPAAAHIKIVLEGMSGPVKVLGKDYNGSMPPWNQLPSEEIAAIVTYERTAFGNKGGAVSVDDVVKAGGRKPAD